MRAIIVGLLFLFVVGSGRYASADAQFKVQQIAGWLKQAADALKANEPNNARSALDASAQALTDADAELKAHPAYPKLVEANDKLVGLLVQLEAQGQAMDDAKTELETGYNELQYGGMSMHKGNAAEAIPRFEACVKSHERVLKANPAIANQRHPSDPEKGRTVKQILDACRENLKAAKEYADGGGRDPARDHEGGKTAIRGYKMAAKIVKAKLDATELFKARDAVRICLEGYDRLTGVKDMSQNGYWVESKEKLPVDGGEITMGELGKRCKAWDKDLATRKVQGCGYLEMSVNQDLKSVRPERWGAEYTAIGMGWYAAKCSRMPKASKLTGIPAKYISQFKANCGTGGVMVSDSNKMQRWEANGAEHRTINLKCWHKGEMQFYGLAPE